MPLRKIEAKLSTEQKLNGILLNTYNICVEKYTFDDAFQYLLLTRMIFQDWVTTELLSERGLIQGASYWTDQRVKLLTWDI